MKEFKKRVPIDLSREEWRELCLKFPGRSLASVLREIYEIGRPILIARSANEEKESL